MNGFSFRIGMEEKISMNNIAIVLAAGQGKRMQSKIQKQFLLLKDKPVLYYSLQVFQASPLIQGIILVTAQEGMELCRQIVEEYHFTKVRNIVLGGKERFDSVLCGLKTINACDYVYIHDGARPFVNEKMLQRLQQQVEQTGACVAGMPVKDTIKVADWNGCVEATPPRERLWLVQTPQVFSARLVKDAYIQYKEQGKEGATDDAMVVEMMTGAKVQLVEGDYRNIKITTPEDLLIGEVFCS